MPQARAAIPEPDNVVYGQIAIGTNAVTAHHTNVVVEVRRSGDTNLLSSYRMGQNPAYGDLYVLEIHLGAGNGTLGLEPITNGSVLDIVVDDGSPEPPSTNFIVGSLTMMERGYVERIDFGALPTNALTGFEAWAAAWGLGNGDADGDGSSNYGEYVAGTNPTNAASRFMLQIAKTNANTEVSFDAVLAEGTGYDGITRHYALEQRAGLTSETWDTVPGYSDLVESNQPVVCTLANTNAPLYFRGKVWLEGEP